MVDILMWAVIILCVSGVFAVLFMKVLDVIVGPIVDEMADDTAKAIVGRIVARGRHTGTGYLIGDVELERIIPIELGVNRAKPEETGCRT